MITLPGKLIFQMRLTFSIMNSSTITILEASNFNKTEAKVDICKNYSYIYNTFLCTHPIHTLF